MEQEATPPRVSALIVSYNCVDNLRRCLEALEKSGQRELLEIIVVDNGSRDGSASLDGEFPNTTFLRLPRNFGRAKALNIAMRSAHADYLLLLAPEVEVRPDTVSALAARLDADSDAVAVAPLLVDAACRPLSLVQPLPALKDLGPLAWRSEPLETLPVDPASAEPVPVPFPDFRAILLRKFFIRGLNYFDERYGHHWLDAELSMQIRRAGRKALLLAGVKVLCHPAKTSFPLTTDALAALAADRALGAATYAGKHFGMLAGLKLRAALVFGALGRTLAAAATFRNPGFEFSRFYGILSGQKIDGSQSAL